MNRCPRKVTPFRVLPTFILLTLLLLPATPSFSGNTLSVDTVQGTSFSLYYNFISSNGRELWFSSDSSKNSSISSTPFIAFGNLQGCAFDDHGNLVVTGTQEFSFDVFAVSPSNSKITLTLNEEPTGSVFTQPQSAKTMVKGNFSWSNPPDDDTIVFEAFTGTSRTGKRVQRSLRIITQTGANPPAECQGQADKLCYRGDLYINPYGGVHVFADGDGSSVASDVHPIEVNFVGLSGGTQPNPPFNTLVVSKGLTLSFNVTASNSGSSGQALNLRKFILPVGVAFTDPKPSSGGQLTVPFQWTPAESGTYTAIFGAYLGSGTTVLNPTFLVLNINVTNEPLPQIGVDNASFSFSGTVGGQNPTQQTLSIQNTGEGTLNWSASKTAAWLNLSKVSGSLTNENSDSIAISADISNLTTGTFTDTITISGGNPSIPSKMVPITLNLSDQPPALEINPANLTPFSATVGSNPPNQSLTVKNIGGGTLNWSASNSKNWLKLSKASGNLTAKQLDSITFSVDTTGLAAFADTDQITIAAPGAVNAPQVVSATLNLMPITPTIGISTQGLTFNGTTGSNPGTQTFTVTNAGGGTLTWSAQASTSSGGSWLNLSPPPSSGSLAAQASGTVTVSVNTSGLASGTYNGSIAITHNATNLTSPQTIPVTLTLTGSVSPPKIGIDPSSLAFSASVGSNPDTKNLTVINTGGGTLNWSASKTATWLTLSKSSGSLGAGLSDSITVSIDASGLTTPQTYTDTIVITHNGTNTTSPLTIQVTLTMTGIVIIPPRIGIDPSSLAFSAAVGSNPDTKNLTVINTGGGTLNWSASKTAAWLTMSKSSGSLGANQSDSITVSVNTSSLTTPGTSTDTIIISGSGASNTPQNVSVTLTLTSNTPTLGISTNNLSFNFIAGSTSPVKQTFYVQNLGGGNLTWSLSFTTPTTQPAWIQSISSTGGTVGPSGSTPIDISVLTSQPAGFLDQAVITIDGGAAGSKTLTVSLNVVAPQPATLGVAPQLGLYLRLPVNSGGYQGSSVLYVWNQGSGTINWQITNTGSTPWLTFTTLTGSSSNDSEPQSGLPVRNRVSIPFNTNGVPAGDYSTSIRVTQTGTTIAYDIPVYLHVFDPGTSKAILYVTPPPVISSMNYGDAGPSIPLMMWVYNDGQSALNWRISKIDYNNSQYASWLSPTSSSGSVPPLTIGNRSYSTLGLSIHPAGMPVGTYDATVVFEDSNAVGSPFFAYVIFKIHKKGWDIPDDSTGQPFIPTNATIKPLDGFPSNMNYSQRGDMISATPEGTVYYSIDGSFSNQPYIAINTNFLGPEVPGYLDVIKDGMSGWQRALGTTTLDNITVSNDPLSNKRWYVRFQFGDFSVSGAGLWTYWSPYSN